MLEKISNASINKQLLQQILLNGIKTDTASKLYKEAGFNFRFTHISYYSKLALQVQECQITSNIYFLNQGNKIIQLADIIKPLVILRDRDCYKQYFII